MKVIQKYREYKRRQHLYNRDSKFIKLHKLDWLTNEELNQIKKTWPCFDVKKEDLIYSMMYKKEYGFSPYFINDYQLGNILNKINPYKQVVSLANKAMIDVYFDELPLPKVIVKRISNIFYDEKMNIITEENVITKLIDTLKFVIKPSVDTGCGKGVKIIHLNSNNDNYIYLKELISLYGNNFIVQEILTQELEFSKLNPSSVNSFRVTSIFLDGKFNCSSILKVGKENSQVDNWNSGYLIGISNAGVLMNHGYDNDLNRIYKTDNGIEFGAMEIKNYDNIIAFVEKYHTKYFPNCGIVGWDIMIDSNNNIRVIEVNLDYPGVVGEQLCSGTFFENFRDEICNLF